MLDIFFCEKRPGSAPKEDRRTPPKLPKLEHVALH